MSCPRSDFSKTSTRSKNTYLLNVWQKNFSWRETGTHGVLKFNEGSETHLHSLQSKLYKVSSFIFCFIMLRLNTGPQAASMYLLPLKIKAWSWRWQTRKQWLGPSSNKERSISRRATCSGDLKQTATLKSQFGGFPPHFRFFQSGQH